MKDISLSLQDQHGYRHEYRKEGEKETHRYQ